MSETKEERITRLFNTMWCDKDGNRVDPPMTEDALDKYIGGMDKLFSKTIPGYKRSKRKK